jgi:hypothetical protein
MDDDPAIESKSGDLDAKQRITFVTLETGWHTGKWVVRLRKIRAPSRPSSPIERFGGRRSHLRVIDDQ